MNSNFELFLFTTQTDIIPESVTAGVAGVIVDWEHNGKRGRQAGADTQINFNTVEDLRRVRACTSATIICRLNGLNESTRDEMSLAIDNGADEVLLPMVRTVKEAQHALEMVDGRCGLGIMVETKEALQCADELGRLPLTRAYVGLNDLSIDLVTPNVFTLLADGTIDRLRQKFGIPFGLSGVTLPELGHPIPCRLIMSEIARLHCQFTILRRSFLADMVGRDIAREIPRILEAMKQAFQRTDENVLRDRQEFCAAVKAWPSLSIPSPTALVS